AEVWKHSVGDAEAVCPDQPVVSSDAPPLDDVSAYDLLAVRGTPQDEPLERKQLRTRREFDVHVPANPSAVENDGLLRQPRQPPPAPSCFVANRPVSPKAGKPFPAAGAATARGPPANAVPARRSRSPPATPPVVLMRTASSTGAPPTLGNRMRMGDR